MSDIAEAPPRQWRLLLGAAALIQVLLFFHYVGANIVLQPYWDMYSHVMRYLQLRADGDWLAYLWAPHVQHRHVWMRLLTWLDAEALSGTSYPFIVTSVACQAGTAWLLWREARIAATPGMRTIAGCLAAMLVLTSVAAVDCALPINSVYPQAVFFGVLSIVLAANGSTRFLIAAAAAAIAAAFANTIALALWPILWWMTWQASAARRVLVPMVLAGVAFSVALVAGLPLADQAAVASSPAQKVDYFFAYMGLPWTRAASLAVPGRIAGAALAFGGAWVLVRYAWQCGLDRAHRVALALIALSGAAAVLAALGRVADPGDVLVPVRYTVLLAPLHVGLLMILLPHAALRARVAGLSAVALAVLLLVQQVGAGEAAKEVTGNIRTTVAQFAAGRTEPGMERVVFDDLPEARQQLDAIQREGLYLNIR